MNPGPSSVAVGRLRRQFGRLWQARYPILGALGMVVLAFAWVFGAHGWQEVRDGRTRVTWLEAVSYDLPFRLRGTGHPHPDVLLVEITPGSFTPRTDRDGDGRIDREVLAVMLDQMRTGRPRLVLLDLLFTDVSDPGTPAFLGALRALAAEAPVVVGTSTLGASEKVHPEVLAAGVRAGLVDVDDQPGHTVRLLPGVFATDAPPSLAWVGAEAVGARVTRTEPPGGLRWLNYRGRGREAFERVDLAAVVEGAPEVLDRMRGRLVCVGFAPPFEAFRNPAGREAVGGVEVHATALVNLLDQAWLRRVPVRWQVAGFMGHAAALGLLLGRRRTVAGMAMAAAALLGVLALAVASHLLAGWWWWWAIPVLATFGWLAGAGVHPGYAAFISYRTSDGADAALALEQGLLARGLRGYLAPGTIEPGAAFAPMLFRRIRRAPHFLLVLSADARRELHEACGRPVEQAGWVVKELREALRLGREILVVRPCLREPGAETAPPRPAAPLDRGELPPDLAGLADLESVVLETGEHRGRSLDRICRRLW